MNLLETIVSASEGGALQAAARQCGLDDAGARSVLANLMPALAGGIRRNVESSGGLEALGQALGSGNHQRYLDDPTALEGESARSDGNAILGHLFGSKDVSREVAAGAAELSGVDVSAIKRFLPIAAATAMGALSKETSAGSNLLGQGSDAGGGLLGRLLDAGSDGELAGKVFSIGKRLF